MAYINITICTIGSGVTSIGQQVFNGCSSITSITVNSNQVLNSGNLKGIGSLQQVIIGNNVTSIAPNSFASCVSLSSVTIGNSVTGISQYAFDGCVSLSSITIPDNVTTIYASVFYNCRNLTACTIGSGVTSIGQQVFFTCSSLTSVTIMATTPPSLGGQALDGNASGRKIYVPSASVSTYKAASGWSSYASDIEAIQ